MTHQEKIDFIRGKVIEAVPEIVELKFGCLAEFVDSTPMILLYSGYDTSDYGNGNFGYTWLKENHVRLFDSQVHGKYKIIGRPIRMSDVLATIEKYQPNFLVVSKNGDMTQVLNALADVLASWNWHKDDLNEQDEATISFLYEILK